MTAVETFRAKAPGIAAKLMGDFPFGVVDSAAVLGNLGHECNGFTALQEISPTVKGSRGGYGWAQWTGPRRRAFEAYCKRNKLDPASDKANYAWLFLELKGSEAGAVGKTLAAQTRDQKVYAFERSYLRAGVPHYPSRRQWAALAAEAIGSAGKPMVATPLSNAERTVILTDGIREADRKRDQASVSGASIGVAGGLGTIGGAGVVAQKTEQPSTPAPAPAPMADWALLGGGLAFVVVAAALIMKARRHGKTAARLAKALLGS